MDIGSNQKQKIVFFLTRQIDKICEHDFKRYYISIKFVFACCTNKEGKRASKMYADCRFVMFVERLPILLVMAPAFCIEFCILLCFLLIF